MSEHNKRRAVSAAIGANVTAHQFRFGDPIPKLDIIFLGAIIHWVFRLTSDFKGDFEAIIRYVISSVNHFLVIEWVGPEDSAVKKFQHIQKCQTNNTYNYDEQTFLLSLKKFGNVVRRQAFNHRIIYTVEINTTQFPL